MDRKEVIERLFYLKSKAENALINSNSHCDWLINDVKGTVNALSLAIAAMQEPERKKGQWEDFDYDNSYLCTSCGEIWTLNDGTPEENNMNYCPNCGADMRGEKVDKKRSDRNIKEK